MITPDKLRKEGMDLAQLEVFLAVARARKVLPGS